MSVRTESRKNTRLGSSAAIASSTSTVSPSFMQQMSSSAAIEVTGYPATSVFSMGSDSSRPHLSIISKMMSSWVRPGLMRLSTSAPPSTWSKLELSSLSTRKPISGRGFNSPVNVSCALDASTSVAMRFPIRLILSSAILQRLSKPNSSAFLFPAQFSGS